MPRIRTIKPEFWEDKKIASLPYPCRLFFIGTWNFADDNGVVVANIPVLKSKIFPYDESLRVSEVQKWIDALIEARMLIPISYNNESYYVIRTFKGHQKIDKRWGKPLLEEDILNQLLAEYSGDTAGTQLGHSGDTPQEEERNRNRNIPPNPLKGDEFMAGNSNVDEVYNAYPAKCVIKGCSTGKSSKNKEKIKSMLKSMSKDNMLITIRQYVKDCQKHNRFMKNFSTFLNQFPESIVDESHVICNKNDKETGSDPRPNFDDFTGDVKSYQKAMYEWQQRNNNRQ